MNQLKTASDLENAFNEWNNTLLRYTYARLGRKQIAEEIVQDAFVKAWRYRESFDPKKASLKSWLFIITINTLRDHFRKTKNKRESELHENFKDSTDIKGDYETDEKIDFVFKQIRHLNERDQNLIILHYREDLSIEEISSVMKMKYSATKTAIHRAMNKLKVICNPVTKAKN
ncbi:MAG: RNA polymerase sigma factor [bacterium]|nr:RNA polymerase sigma factor [bacterium]